MVPPMPTTISTALADRKGDNQKFDLLRHRARDAARHQETETPPESADHLLNQAIDVRMRQADRIAAINHANTLAVIDFDGTRMTITEAIARRDALGDIFKLTTDVADVAVGGGRDSYGYGRTTRSEIAYVSGVGDVVELRRQADAIAAEMRELDTAIQAAGHANTLAE